MQHATQSEVEAQSGTIQTPLTRVEQITSGAIITGPAWRGVWQVESLTEGQVIMQRFPLVLDPSHTHAFRTGSACACGAQRQDPAHLLPQHPGLHRTFVLEPQGLLRDVDPYTIYISHNRFLNAVGGEWASGSARVPVVPILHPVWSLPQALRPRG